MLSEQPTLLWKQVFYSTFAHVFWTIECLCSFWSPKKWLHHVSHLHQIRHRGFFFLRYLTKGHKLIYTCNFHVFKTIFGEIQYRRSPYSVMEEFSFLWKLAHEGHSLLNGVNEILPLFLFFSPNVDGVWYRQSAHSASMNFMKIGAVKGILYLWVSMKFFPIFSAFFFCIG